MANWNDLNTRTSPLVEVTGGDTGNLYLNKRPESIAFGTNTATKTPTIPQVNEGPVTLEQVRELIRKIPATTVPGGTLTFGTEVTTIDRIDRRFSPEELKLFRNQTIVIASKK